MLPYIGSSLDPDMEDIAELERTLQGAVTRDLCLEIPQQLIAYLRRWAITPI